MNRLLFFKSINIPAPEERIYGRLGYRKGKTLLLPHQKEELGHYLEEALTLVNLRGAGMRIPIKEKTSSRIVLSTGITFEALVKSPNLVTPAQAGVYKYLKELGSHLRGNDKKGRNSTFYETITFESKRLSAFLGNCREIVLMGATAGSDIIEAIRKDSTANDLTRAVVFDAVGSEIVDASLDWIMDYYNRDLLRENKYLTAARFSAGYHDFLLENQQIIYHILQLWHIGISINENCILMPDKSVTAIAGVEDIKYQNEK